MGVPVRRWRLFFKFESHCFADSAGADCCRWGVLFLRVREEVASLIICLAARWWGFERIGQGQVALMLRQGLFRFDVFLVWIPVGFVLIVDRNPMRRLILRDSRTGFRGRWGGRRDPFAWMHSLGRHLWGPRGAVLWYRPSHRGGILVIVIMLGGRLEWLGVGGGICSWDIPLRVHWGEMCNNGCLR